MSGEVESSRFRRVVQRFALRQNRGRQLTLDQGQR